MPLFQRSCCGSSFLSSLFRRNSFFSDCLFRCGSFLCNSFFRCRGLLRRRRSSHHLAGRGASAAHQRFLGRGCHEFGAPHQWTCGSRHTVARGYVQGRSPSTRHAGPRPCATRTNSFTTGRQNPLARRLDWVHRNGVEGTSTRRHGQERTGDGASPVARSPEKISPEPPEET